MKLNRRTFLQQTTLVMVAAGTAPLLRAAEGRPAPSQRVNLGFIGTGRQAIHANIPGFLHQKDAQVVAVCDTDTWRMEQAREVVNAFYAKQAPGGTYSGCAMVPDWLELLRRKDIDAVMISTPDHWHYLHCVASLKAGKHVACEKPLFRNISEGRTVVELVKKTGLVFSTDSEFRSYRICHLAAELVRNKKIGELKRIITGTPIDPTLGPQPEMPVPKTLDYEMWLGPAPKAPYTEKRVHPPQDTKGRPGWLCISDYSDGMIANWGAHLNDLAMRANNTELTGPIAVKAKGEFPPPGNLWNIMTQFEAEYQFANGVTLICKSEKPFVRFEGTGGWIQVNYPMNIQMSDEDLLLWKPGPGDVALPTMTSEKREFLDAIHEQRQPQYGAEGGHRNATLSHLALASMKLGRPIKWDPATETVVGDAEAKALLAPKPLRAPWNQS
jgi:myo-inositol 2-dehydrogenase/D-chiro-inositol 1-dehydrogenase